MRTLFLISIAILSGCATTEWSPSHLESKTIRVEIMDEKEWAEYQGRRNECSGQDWCYLTYESILGTADWSNPNECVIRLPGHKGMPAYHTIVHEIRHCYQGGHSKWMID